MDWFSSGRIDSFRYVRVAWGSWEETEELTGITGGSLERNNLTAIKASGSLTYYDEPLLGRDLLRVYSDSIDPLTGERLSKAHGTYLAATPSSTHRGMVEEGTADLYSVLQVLAEDALEAPIVVSVGDNAVAKARTIIEETGLPVVAPTSTVKLTTTAVFDEEDASKLDAVNWLLSFAGFESANCDGFGNVLLRPYMSPAKRKPSFTMSDDKECVYRSGVVRECDRYSVPNVVKMTCSNAGTSSPLIAVSENIDPLSTFSIPSRGRRIVHRESVSDIASQDALQAKADAVLTAKTSAAESFEIIHAYRPMDMGDVCNFVYNRAGIQRSDLMIVRQIMALRPGMECTTQFQRV